MALPIYLRKRLILILLLGFISALPLALTGSTLAIYVTEFGVEVQHIGLLALVGLAYSWKFLWSPVVEYISKFSNVRRLGGKKFILFIVNILLASAIISMSLFDPKNQLTLLALTASIVAFISATQDILIDGIRINMLREEEQAGGASMAVVGYRLGMIASSAGSLYIAHFISWNAVFYSGSLISLISCMLFILLSDASDETEASNSEKTYKANKASLKEMFVEPLVDISGRYYIWAVVIFVIFFKLSDAFTLSLFSTFLMQSGFDKLTIANISKTVGLLATIFGGLIGGIIAEKVPQKKFLMFGLMSEMVTNLSYLILSYIPGKVAVLTAVVVVDNVFGGLSTIALVSYISSICNKQFSATQYATASAIATFGRTWIVSVSGYIVAAVGWSNFFLFSVAASIPALIVFRYATSPKPKKVLKQPEKQFQSLEEPVTH